MSLVHRVEQQTVAEREMSRLAWMALMLTPGMGPTTDLEGDGAVGGGGAAVRGFVD